MTHKAQTLFHNKELLNLAKRILIIGILSTIIGFTAAHFLIPKKKNIECLQPKLNTIQLLISSDNGTKNWNNISLSEGESVVSILERVNKANNIELTLSGEKKARIIQSLLGKNSDGGEWKYYINATTPNINMDSYYPKAGDVISIIYTSK